MADELTIGAWVFTSDGKELGRVKKVEEGAFQLDAPLAFDYWLQRAIIQNSTAERVELVVSNSDLGGYKMDRPNDPNGFQQATPSVEPAAVRDRTLLR